MHVVGISRAGNKKINEIKGLDMVGELVITIIGCWIAMSLRERYKEWRRNQPPIW